MEGKVNETYKQSCRNTTYASTIKGQLELKWRLISLYFANECRTHNNQTYIIENEDYRDCYIHQGDNFYTDARINNPEKIASWRRLILKEQEGVKDIFDNYISQCKQDQIYFLTISNENDIPINGINGAPLPELIGSNWDESKKRFCWLPAKFIEDCNE